MALADNSNVTRKFKRSLRKQVVFRELDGKTVVSIWPKRRTGDPTPEEAKGQERFSMASRYAKAIITSADQSLAEAYASALKPRQNVYSRALQDFMTSPVVTKIDTSNYNGAAGDKIVIIAMDDFRVTALRAEIYAVNGRILEAGNAKQNINGMDWTYTATQVNPASAGPAGAKIKAIATDVPGNEGMLEVTCPLFFVC